MIIELKEKKERLEKELAACLISVNSGELQAWETEAFNDDIHEMTCDLEHTNNCIAMYS